MVTGALKKEGHKLVIQVFLVCPPAAGGSR